MSNRLLLNLVLVGFGIFMAVVVLLFDASLVSLALSPVRTSGGQGVSASVPLAVMLNLGLLFWGWLLWWRVPEQRSFDPEWPGVIRYTPRGPRARLLPMNRMFGVLGVGQLATYFAHLAATLIVTPNLASAELPAFQSLALVIAGLFWFLGGCAAAVLWWWEPLVGVVQDDENAGTLRWRNPGGKGQEGAVARRWVTRVSVREGQRVSQLLDATSYDVVLHWTNAKGERMSDTIVTYLNPADAEALAGWIRGRLGLGDGG